MLNNVCLRAFDVCTSQAAADAVDLLAVAEVVVAHQKARLRAPCRTSATAVAACSAPAGVAAAAGGAGAVGGAEVHEAEVPLGAAAPHIPQRLVDATRAEGTEWILCARQPEARGQRRAQQTSEG